MFKNLYSKRKLVLKFNIFLYLTQNYLNGKFMDNKDSQVHGWICMDPTVGYWLAKFNASEAWNTTRIKAFYNTGFTTVIQKPM